MSVDLSIGGNKKVRTRKKVKSFTVVIAKNYDCSFFFSFDIKFHRFSAQRYVEYMFYIMSVLYCMRAAEHLADDS